MSLPQLSAIHFHSMCNGLASKCFDFFCVLRSPTNPSYLPALHLEYSAWVLQVFRIYFTRAHIHFLIRCVRFSLYIWCSLFSSLLPIFISLGASFFPLRSSTLFSEMQQLPFSILFRDHEAFFDPSTFSPRVRTAHCVFVTSVAHTNFWMLTHSSSFIYLPSLKMCTAISFVIFCIANSIHAST